MRLEFLTWDPDEAFRQHRLNVCCPIATSELTARRQRPSLVGSVFEKIMKHDRYELISTKAISVAFTLEFFVSRHHSNKIAVMEVAN